MTTTSPVAAAAARRRPLGNRGNILIYVLMTMVVFGLIGAAMVALFSTSVSSSATANETRRAFYLSESGIRYAISELRQGGFSATNINQINANTVSVPPAGSFRATVFGAWFQSPSNQNVAGGTLAVELEKGRIPTGFSARLNTAVPDLYLVVAGIDPRSTTQTPNANEVANVNSFTASSDTAGSFDIADQLVVGRDKRICMAVQPRTGADQSFTPSAGGSAGSLELKQKAAAIFPKTDGSFLFAGKAYFYRSAVEDTANSVFRLNDITAGPNVTNASVTVTAADYILLAPNNYFVTARGTSPNNVEFGGDMDHSAALASHSAADLSEPDIPPVAVGDVAQIESGSGFMGGGTDTQGDYLQIGSSAGMGAMWYNQNLYLGGATNYCTSAPDINSRRGCFFESGMRAFFTLEYSGTGDGLIFALMNGQLNQLNSAGGDFEASELLGYAGDSRTNNSGGFIDTTGVKGLRPPKMGLEFDTNRNWDSTFEAKPTDYCSGSSLKQNTRNDPDPASAAKDFVQYVYWGNTSGVNVPCRTTPSDRSSTYDDNRHNPGASPTGDWVQSLTGLVNTSASVSADGRTVYVATNNSDTNPTSGRLYFIDLDAQGYVSSVSTWGPASNGVTSPALDSSGNIYVGAGNALYAFRPDRSLRFSYTLQSGTRANTPVIGSDGTIYVSAYDGVKFGFLYAIRPDGSLKSGWGSNPQVIQFFKAAPVLTPDGSLVIAATDSQRVYALKTSDGLPDPSWGLSGIFLSAGATNTPGVGPGATSKGTVYVAAGDRRVYALSGEDGSTLLTSSAFASEGLSTQPLVSGGTVFVGSFDDNLYALNTTDLGLRWSYYAAGNVQSRPTVDSNGHIYFGSDIRDPFVNNSNVNALYPDGTLKWQFSTGSGDVRGTPAVRPDGTVYIGSFNFNLYAINQFAVPKSLKDKSITYDAGAVGGVAVSVDSTDDWLKSSTSKGPWAVRMEVYRNSSPNASAPVGYYSYLLRTWVRQCQQAGCSDVIGSYYDDTHLAYSPALRPPQMEQTINLSATENTQFQRFIFGFTSQTASGDNQQAVIRELKLGFVRPTDPTVTCDPKWPDGTTCP